LKQQKPTLTSTFELAVDAARAGGRGAAHGRRPQRRAGLVGLLLLAHAYAQQRG
jgi:hypothetical protein